MEQEQSSGVQNKGLLITALVLGVLVVLVYNWHIGQVRQAGIGETVELLVLKRNMESGEKVEDTDLKVVRTETHFKEGIGQNVIFNTKPGDLKDEVLSRRVLRGRFLRWEDFVGHEPDPNSEGLEEGKESFQITIEPRESPGQMLRVGDRVALLGILALGGGKPLKTYRILDGAKVVSIGGIASGPTRTTSRTRGSSGYTRAQRTYRTIGIELDKKTVLKLNDVLTRLVGSLRIDVLSRKNKQDFVKKQIVLSDELKGVTAVDLSRGGSTS